MTFISFRSVVAVLLLCLAWPSAAVEREENGAYFPDSAFARENSDGSLFREWYGNYLSALGEPSLFAAPNSDMRIYRFLWLRSFHDPIAVRVEIEPDGDALLYYVRASRARGYEPGLIERKSRRLSAAQTASIERRFAKLSLCQPRDDDTHGLDGSEWVYEMRSPTRYCAMNFWTPSGKLADAGLQLLKLAGFVATNADPIY